MRGKGDKKNGGKGGVTIIRREEVVEGGHHGGAWKVAYADFVTAMMAFFLLMWLINATTEAQRKGLADYFSPTNLLSHGSSGTGQPFGGTTVFSHGTMISDRGSVEVVPGPRPPVRDVQEDNSDTPAQPRAYRRDAPNTLPDRGLEGESHKPTGKAGDAAVPMAGGTAISGGGGAAVAGTLGAASAGHPGARTLPAKPAPEVPAAASGADSGADGNAGPGAARAARAAKIAAARAAAMAAAQAESQALNGAAQAVQAAIAADPALAPLAHQLAVDVTPEGLRIQILDEEHKPMFASGAATPNPAARKLLAVVAPILAKMPESIAITGHTDAAPYPGTGMTNWELSAGRANATRHLLEEDGLPDARITRVSGRADRDPLLPADPLAAANRRIAIVVLRKFDPKTIDAMAANALAADGAAQTNETEAGETAATPAEGTQPGPAPFDAGPADAGPASAVPSSIGQPGAYQGIAVPPPPPAAPPPPPRP